GDWSSDVCSSDLSSPGPLSIALLLRVALVELRPQQCPEVGRAGAGGRVLGAQLLHRLGLLREVFRLHREVDRAILAVYVDDHGLDRKSVVEKRAQIVDAVARE